MVEYHIAGSIRLRFDLWRYYPVQSSSPPVVAPGDSTDASPQACHNQPVNGISRKYMLYYGYHVNETLTGGESNAE